MNIAEAVFKREGEKDDFVQMQHYLELLVLFKADGQCRLLRKFVNQTFGRTQQGVRGVWWVGEQCCYVYMQTLGE